MPDDGNSIVHRPSSIVHRPLRTTPSGARCALSDWALVGVAVGCALAVGVASLRHTGSLAFPIDDGYIYSNYVLSASQGHLFSYNPGETSGGITSPGWYLLCTLAYLLLAPFHGLLG